MNPRATNRKPSASHSDRETWPANRCGVRSGEGRIDHYLDTGKRGFSACNHAFILLRRQVERIQRCSKFAPMLRPSIRMSRKMPRAELFVEAQCSGRLEQECCTQIRPLGYIEPTENRRQVDVAAFERQLDFDDALLKSGGEWAGRKFGADSGWTYATAMAAGIAWAIGIFVMASGEGLVDTLRLGEGVKEGSVAGIAHDGWQNRPRMF